ncbi:MAG: FHA domain-containing protein [Cytophagales bacterium]
MHVGNSEQCDIQISGKYINEQHAILHIYDDIVSIEDLNSTHGTFINGKKIKNPQFLNSKDRVKLGPLVFNWQDYLIHNTYNEVSTLYFVDLFSPFGSISWSDYKIVLLISLGLGAIYPLAVPIVLRILETKIQRIFRHYENLSKIDLIQFLEISYWVVGITMIYVFLNLTQKYFKGYFGK